MKCLLLAVGPMVALATCPFMNVGTPPSHSAEIITDDAFKVALAGLDIARLETSLFNLMTDSQDCWPADGGHYGGFMIRLAWHCSGTYRNTDDHGGCAGGRIRFPPEADWEDNGNLEYARALLVPIKEEYGDALSWGDLITFAGTVAIRSMGGPTDPHCFGRVDDKNGSKSNIFGTTEDWKETACEVQGNCQKPMGAVKVGLIYVNPEGPLKDPMNMSSGQNPDPAKSAAEIREVFGRMGMNDSETASLIAGGHAFGMCHGDDGDDGDGVVTSGFHGQWTTTPSTWTNQFITGMIDEEWEQTMNPSNTAVQWRTKNRASSLAGTMRLTSDLALVKDETYLELVKHWVCDQQKLDVAFAQSWKKLMESGGGWLPEEERKCEPTSKATGQQADPNKNQHSVCPTHQPTHQPAHQPTSQEGSEGTTTSMAARASLAALIVTALALTTM